MQGLPTDDLSVQNGIMVTRATRYPVLVDPQGQGRTWIMHREEANQLKVTQLNDKLFRNHLEVSKTGLQPEVLKLFSLSALLCQAPKHLLYQAKADLYIHLQSIFTHAAVSDEATASWQQLRSKLQCVLADDMINTAYDLV